MREDHNKLLSPTTGAVTFLDVIGWKGVWQRKTEAIDDLQSLIEELENKKEEFGRGLGETALELKTHISSISDTIVIFTESIVIFKESNKPKEYAQEALELHGRLCAHVIPISISKGIPLRGASGYGEFSMKGNIYVGKAIDEAASWHEGADWIGVFMTPSAAFVFNTSKSKKWLLYKPPLKLNNGWETACINWTENWIEVGKDKDDLKKHFLDMGPIIPEISGKFINTLSFYDLMLKKNSNPQ